MTQTVVEPKCVYAVSCLLAHLVLQIFSFLTSMATKVVGAQRNHRMVYYVLLPCTVPPNHPKKKGSDGATVLQSICSWLVSSSALNTFFYGEYLITLVLGVFDICPTSFANPKYLCITALYINSTGLCWCLVPDSAGHLASVLSLCSYDGT